MESEQGSSTGKTESHSEENSNNSLVGTTNKQKILKNNKNLKGGSFERRGTIDFSEIESLRSEINDISKNFFKITKLAYGKTGFIHFVESLFLTLCPADKVEMNYYFILRN